MTTPAGKLIWRCRRGTKELDRVFNGFLNNHYDEASDELRAAFEQLLEEQDPDVYDWLMQVSVPNDPKLKLIMVELQKLSHLKE